MNKLLKPRASQTDPATNLYRLSMFR